MRSGRILSLQFWIVEIRATRHGRSTSTLDEASIFDSIGILRRVRILESLSYLIKGTYIYFGPFNNNYVTFLFLLHMQFFFLFDGSN